MSDIASVEEFIKTTAALVLASITDEGGSVQPGAGIVPGLEVFAGGITESAVATQLSALRRMTRTNVTTVALAEQSACIVRLIERIVRLADPVSLNLLGDGRWILAKQRRDDGDRSSKHELPLNLAAGLKRQVLLVAGNQFTHNDAS